MLSLVLRDLLLLKKTMLLAVGYALFILIAFQNEVLAATSYIMGGVAIAYAFILYSCAYDEKNNADITLNSLPLRREKVVGARYVSVLLFFALAITIMGGFGLVMKGLSLPFPKNYMTWFDVLTVFTASVLLFAIYFPFFFRFGYIKSRIFNLLLFFGFFFGPSYLVGWLKEHYSLETIEEVLAMIGRQPSWSLTLDIVGIMLVLLYLSYRLSVVFYRQREF